MKVLFVAGVAPIVPDLAAARLLGPEGLVIGLSYAPWFHEDGATASTESTESAGS